MKKIVYQIYLPSFKDTNNNGYGDLKGVINKLAYFKKLGVDYLWITPFFKSPFKDNGYDISDYYQVDPRFGTNEDLKTLIAKAQKYNLKIMLDMVFNHTSTTHPWFKKWLAKDKKYQDFYISKTSVNKPPTNWKSKFGGSAWKEYAPHQWYLHLFDETQADLNWKNPQVRKEVKKVLRYYINLGIKGFRFDVINLIAKNKFVDDHQGNGFRFYTDGNKVHDYIKELRKEFPDDLDFLTVGELSSTTLKHALKYANKNRSELDSVFTFHHLKIDYQKDDKFAFSEPDFAKFNALLKTWYLAASKNKVNLANFLNNHDQPRSISRFIAKPFRLAGGKMLLALMASLPGIVYLYQGEEIGMENLDFTSKNDFKDVESLNYLAAKNLTNIPKGLKQKSRDNARSPMQWNSEKYGGFSKVKPWIKVNQNYQTINVEKALANPNSLWHFYQKFITFVKNDLVLNKGMLSFNDFKNNLISYNLTYHNIKYKLTFSFNNYLIEYNFKHKQIIYSNYHKHKINYLKPYQFIIERIDDENKRP